MIESAHIAVKNILFLKAIVPSAFMRPYIAIIATILAVLLWHIDSAAALKCNGSGLECSLTGHLRKTMY